MVILYNKERELYYKVDVTIIDPHGEWEDYDMSIKLVNDLKLDTIRQAYIINNKIWEGFKDVLDDFVSTNGSFRSHEDIKHYAIYVAVPLYKVYDDCNEWVNENWTDTLEDVQNSFLKYEETSMKKYTVVPYPADECEFYPRIERWSGDY